MWLWQSTMPTVTPVKTKLAVGQLSVSVWFYVASEILVSFSLDNGYCWWNQLIARHNDYLTSVKSRRIQLHAYKLHIVLVFVIQSFNNHDFGMCHFSGSSETMKESRHFSWIFLCSFSTHFGRWRNVCGFKSRRSHLRVARFRRPFSKTALDQRKRIRAQWLLKMPSRIHVKLCTYDYDFWLSCPLSN